MMLQAVRALRSKADSTLAAACSTTWQLLSTHSACTAQYAAAEEPSSSSTMLLLARARSGPVHSSSAVFAAARRGFAAFSSPLAHSGCGEPPQNALMWWSPGQQRALT